MSGIADQKMEVVRVRPPRTPGLAVAGFAISLLALFYAPLFAIFTMVGTHLAVGVVLAFPGLILSAAGYGRAQREGRRRGLALAGVIIGLTGVVLTCTVLLFVWL